MITEVALPDVVLLYLITFVLVPSNVRKDFCRSGLRLLVGDLLLHDVKVGTDYYLLRWSLTSNTGLRLFPLETRGVRVTPEMDLRLSLKSVVRSLR